MHLGKDLKEFIGLSRYPELELLWQLRRNHPLESSCHDLLSKNSLVYD